MTNTININLTNCNIFVEKNQLFKIPTTIKMQPSKKSDVIILSELLKEMEFKNLSKVNNKIIIMNY